MGKYDDIIDLPHHVSSVHPQMSIWDRSAQFSPFAALTGHEAAIEETARLTEQWHEPDEDKKKELDEKLRQIIFRHNENSKVQLDIIYFKPDALKTGGSYEHVTGQLKRVDETEHRLVLITDEGVKISIDTERIFDIE